MVKLAEILTIAQAAEIKGITRQAIHYAIEHHKLKVVSVLGRVGIYPSELEKYVPTPAKIGKRNGKTGTGTTAEGG